MRKLAGVLWTGVAAAACASAPGEEMTAAASPTPDARYAVYVGAESADLMHRVTLGPEGARVEQTTVVGEIPVETEGPHGFGRSPDGRFIYMTTGHGAPDGKLWKFEAGPDTLVGEPVALGLFPATLDVTPDGLFVLVANFNLHGDHVPSDVSVVYAPDMVEVARIETCTMPHGARIEPSGAFLYSNCMMDDVLVEIDTRTFEVTRRVSVASGQEGTPAHPPAHAGHAAPMTSPECSPTWVQPHPDGTRLYVACNRGHRILELDRTNLELLRTFPTGQGPYNLAVSPNGTRLVATLKSEGAVEFFDLERGMSMGRSPASTTVPHGVVISPDGRYAFVSVEGVGAEPGKVDIFEMADGARIADVEVGQQAGGITFWNMEQSSR